LVAGGLAGSFLTERYRRKHGRLQKIPLIERVNRTVNPQLQGGITLARVLDDQLCKLNYLREYQFTLRNTSTVHLQNVEIQFEFPALDVQGYASPRTTLSKTALVRVGAVPTEGSDYPTVFRWRIPHLPSGDSVEFTFQAVDPTTHDYEVALYNSERVIVEKVEGEPAPAKDYHNLQTAVLGGAMVAFVAVSAFIAVEHRLGLPNDVLTVVKDAGCDLQVVSTYDRYSPGSSVRKIQHRIYNVGQSCVIQSEQFDPNWPLTIRGGETITRESLAQSRPKLTDIEVSVNASNTAPKKTIFRLFVAP
jgi:hypothetical protein